MALLRKRSTQTRFVAVVGVSLAVFFSLSAVGLGAGATVKANSGAFATALPHGFANNTAAVSGSAVRVDLLITAPAVDGFAVNINVVRERITTTNVTALIDASLAFIKDTARAHAFSTIQSLSVDGAAARAVGFLNTLGSGPVVHQRQVYVIHDGWGYAITDSALKGSQYQRSVAALRQLLASWRWL